MFSYFFRLNTSPYKIDFFEKIFRKNGYPENFIYKYFETFLDNTHLVRKYNSDKKVFDPSLLKTRATLQHELKGGLNCYNLEIAFKC